MKPISQLVGVILGLTALTLGGCAASETMMKSDVGGDYALPNPNRSFLDPGPDPSLAVPAAAVDPATPRAATQPARLIIYSAAFRVVVADVAGTIRSIIDSANEMGGHMQEVSGSAVVVRVPASRFQDAVQFVERSGEVTERQIKAQDITEQMMDLRIHLDNAEKLRQRLAELLAKADKIEDAIKIESELARVTGMIDATKGKIRFLESQAAMSTLRVELNSPVPQNSRGTGPRLPFAWVEQLGGGLVAGNIEQSTRKAGFFSRGPSFQPPAGFVRYYEASDEVDAMDAGGLLIRVQERDNMDKAALEFWSKLIRRQLVEGRALAITGEEMASGGYVVTGTREVGGSAVGYMLAVKRTNSDVTIFEAWGPKAQFDQAVAALKKSALTIRGD